MEINGGVDIDTDIVDMESNGGVNIDVENMENNSNYHAIQPGQLIGIRKNMTNLFNLM